MLSPRIIRLYGKGYWRTMKGSARIRLRNGWIRLAEIHWYEAHGLGKKEFKRKRYLDETQDHRGGAQVRVNSAALCCA